MLALHVFIYIQYKNPVDFIKLVNFSNYPDDDFSLVQAVQAIEPTKRGDQELTTSPNQKPKFMKTFNAQ
jgi:hypothetical protein